MLFGVSPTEPATGFGYIERGAALSENRSAFRVASFREKPDAETAVRYLAEGGFPDGMIEEVELGLPACE